MRGRAWRRAQRERIRAKRINHYDGWGKESPRAAGMVTTTSTLCSCWMCGNPRKWFGEETRQEQIHTE